MKAKERARDEAKKFKVFAVALIEEFKTAGITAESKWEEMKSKVETTEAYLAIPLEADRKKVFDVSTI